MQILVSPTSSSLFGFHFDQLVDQGLGTFNDLDSATILYLFFLSQSKNEVSFELNAIMLLDIIKKCSKQGY